MLRGFVSLVIQTTLPGSFLSLDLVTVITSYIIKTMYPSTDLDKEARMLEYRRLMTSLPLVPQRTARKLFAHLHCLHTMSRVNKMCASNLASVWAPTIMPTALVCISHKYICFFKNFDINNKLTHILIIIKVLYQNFCLIS